MKKHEFSSSMFWHVCFYNSLNVVKDLDLAECNNHKKYASRIEIVYVVMLQITEIVYAVMLKNN